MSNISPASSRSAPKTIELPEELWQDILELLKRPLPPPTGKNERSSVRQPELATMMCVSKLLNNLTAPFLYTIVVTDNFPSFLRNFGKSSRSPGIQSKRDLLQYTSKLFLEYGDKGEPSYHRLMTCGGDLFSLLRLPNDSDITPICRKECAGILASAKMLQNKAKSLKVVATGAFLDGQHAIWDRLFHREPDLKKNAYMSDAGSHLGPRSLPSPFNLLPAN